MFFDIYYNSSATQCHGGNIRHLKKGLGLQFGLVRRVLLTDSQNKKKEWCWPAAAVYPKKKKRTIVRQQLRPPDPLSSFEEGAKNGARARPRAKLFWVAK